MLFHAIFLSILLIFFCSFKDFCTNLTLLLKWLAPSHCSRVFGEDSSLLSLPQKTQKESNHDSTSLWLDPTLTRTLSNWLKINSIVSIPERKNRRNGPSGLRGVFKQFASRTVCELLGNNSSSTSFKFLSWARELFVSFVYIATGRQNLQNQKIKCQTTFKTPKKYKFGL
jgi:hypothetical protein